MGTITRLTVFSLSSVLCEENRFKHVEKFTNEIDNIAVRATKMWSVPTAFSILRDADRQF